MFLFKKFNFNKPKQITALIRRVHETTKKPFTIIVEGNIGSGKTTFINHFKSNKDILTLTEPVEEWKNLKGYNLLHLMYNDINKWAFTFQTYVQLTMTRLHEMETLKPVKMIERSIYSARYCFIENLHREGVLPPAQVVVLDEWFKWLISREKLKCDLIVYLRTSPEVAYERIKARKCEEEKNLMIEFVSKLHQCHEDWLYLNETFTCPAPVLILDANKNLQKIKEEYEVFQNEVDVKLRTLC
ncbi:UNVERIFIED_CONTAM: hypothetical protein PYX00_008793 [Menopon gallinae]|uniref:Deoxynucleoside kinase domain-containing protein n=1 Tax=Menopon gallinae TaxID=328185 RepID=A0AAW2HPP8_9NEOP